MRRFLFILTSLPLVLANNSCEPMYEILGLGDLQEFSDQKSTESQEHDFLNSEDMFKNDSDNENSPDEDNKCYSNLYSEYIGENINNLYDESNITSKIRVIYPEQVISYDYRPERLNVQINVSGEITRFYCG